MLKLIIVFILLKSFFKTAHFFGKHLFCLMRQRTLWEKCKITTTIRQLQKLTQNSYDNTCLQFSVTWKPVKTIKDARQRHTSCTSSLLPFNNPMIKVIVANTLLDALVFRRAGSWKHSLNFILYPIMFVVCVHNPSLKVKGTGMRIVGLGYVKQEGIIQEAGRRAATIFLLQWFWYNR